MRKSAEEGRSKRNDLNEAVNCRFIFYMGSSIVGSEVNDLIGWVSSLSWTRGFLTIENVDLFFLNFVIKGSKKIYVCVCVCIYI